ncbi:histidine kinase [Helicobacter cappadocius]|uniref:Histidine kinase n=1 Tax=Helicobacter cappadocius TaxID=3063998 RepID=A0AA90ST69_9HELI|nr:MULTISPECIES: histidine kinase [unclassified Helicobacter]MDO7253746.1 histidine kinase [Helicobacter sp. faydin-H75]MDP2539674.1 histidine kinase [Helicobacter sp. faydin-H76]
MQTNFQINNDPKKRTLIKKGFKAFVNQEYKIALRFFSDALFLDKDDLSARIGLLLSDMAMDFPREAYGFYELYETMTNTQPRVARAKIQHQILELINSFDANLDKMSTVISNEDNAEAENIDGILYPDFKKICQNKNFKEVFENLIFSTKIVFTNKNDFYDFLDLLVENNFYEMSISYIENMPGVAIYDTKIRKILQKAVNKTK